MGAGTERDVHLSSGLRPVFYRLHCTVFMLKILLFIVCCTALSIHICLFTGGAVSLGIEPAPLSEDDEEDFV